jgi:hypothetical protein
VTARGKRVDDRVLERFFKFFKELNRGSHECFGDSCYYFGRFSVEQGFMTEVLLIPILLEALVVIPILITVPDTANRNKQ